LGLEVVVAVLAFGFPATVVLAWIFDVTSTGVARTAGQPDASAMHSFVRREFVMLFAALAAASALLGAG